jgi:hypothetical protein
VAWSAEEVKSEIAGNYLLKLVQITVPDPDFPERLWKKSAWASHPLADGRGRAYDPGDVAKSAYSKALVKACSLLGIGLQQLWGVEADDYPTDAGQTLPWEGPSQFAQPPVPQPQPVAGPGSQMPMQGPPPQMVNPNMGPVQANPPMPPQQQMQAPAAMPQMGNPNQGFTSGPGTPAEAQMQMQSIPPQQYGGPQQQMMPPMGNGMMNGAGNPGNIIAAHQVSAIRGAATMNGYPDAMILVQQALGAGAQNIRAVEDLSHDQAMMVLEYVRQSQGV